MMENAGIYISRHVDGRGAIAVSAKGGHNEEPHNHNDLGSFIFYADGIAYLVDPGAGIYTKQYFGEERYEQLHTGSHGHSVPIVDGEVQQVGKEACAQIIHARLGEDTDEFALDLTAAYSSRNLSKLHRFFRFEKQARSLQLTDTFEFEHQPGAVTERFVTFQKPELVQPGLIRIRGNGTQWAEMAYDAERLQAELSSAPFVPTDKERETLYLIDLHLAQPVKQEQVTIKVQHCTDNG